MRVGPRRPEAAFVRHARQRAAQRLRRQSELGVRTGCQLFLDSRTVTATQQDHVGVWNGRHSLFGSDEHTDGRRGGSQRKLPGTEEPTLWTSSDSGAPCSRSDSILPTDRKAHFAKGSDVGQSKGSTPTLPAPQYQKHWSWCVHGPSAVADPCIGGNVPAETVCHSRVAHGPRYSGCCRIFLSFSLFSTYLE